MSNRLLILGDISFKNSFENIFLEKGKSIFGDLDKLIANSDTTVANLETPIIDGGKPILKSGPSIKINEENFNRIVESGIDALSLSNNHILDYGIEGLDSTINILKKNNISYFGIHCDENVDWWISEINKKKIGFISFAEQEFNYDFDRKIGAVVFNPLTSIGKINCLKKQVDYLIVLYHGGIEHYNLPSPRLQEKCRAMCDAGADLITCQHSHCIGAYEEYNESFILYGQGNTVFGHRENDNEWNEGLTIEIDINQLNTKPKLFHHKFTKNGIVLSKNHELSLRMKELDNLSKNVYDYTFIKKSWEEFCIKNSALNLPLFYGWSLNLIRINRVLKGKLDNLVISKKSKRITNNMVRCDSHREVIETILKGRNS